MSKKEIYKNKICVIINSIIKIWQKAFSGDNMLKIAVFDQDQSYMTRLMQQLAGVQSRYLLFAFTEWSSLLQQHDALQFDVLIGNGEIEKGTELFKRVLTLTDDPSVNDLNHVYRYQSASQFLAALDNCLAFNRERVDQPCQISVVVSAEGGAGKTQFAVSLARLMAEQSRTLLLSLECHSDLSCRIPTLEDFTVTDLLYAVLSEKQAGNVRLREALVVEPYLGFVVPAPVVSASDLEGVTADQLALLCRTLVEASNFQQIVIDCGQSFHGATQAALQLADHLWIIASDTPFAGERMCSLKRDLDRLFAERQKRIRIHEIQIIAKTKQSERVRIDSALGLIFETQLFEQVTSAMDILAENAYFKTLKAYLEAGGC
jgi:cellulose biosynthesis protein BcsQ